MPTVLFAPSYCYKFDEKQWKNQQPYPPYGTLCAAAVMREAGFDVALFDTHLCDDPADIRVMLAEKRPRYLVIYDDGFNYLTKMCLTKMRQAAFDMAKIGREYGCTVVVSSSDATDHSAEYLREGADFILIGEAELTLRELLLALEAGRDDVSGILGLASRPGPLSKGEALPTERFSPSPLERGPGGEAREAHYRHQLAPQQKQFDQQNSRPVA